MIHKIYQSPIKLFNKAWALAEAQRGQDAIGVFTEFLTQNTGHEFTAKALARRGLRIRCVATSPATATAARGLGLVVDDFDDVPALDIAIDGADQVAPDSWLIKGGGAAHTREKLVASAATRFVVIVDPSKVVPSLAPPVPLELVAFGLRSTLDRLAAMPGAAEVTLRDVPRSPDGGVIADLHVAVGDPAALAATLSATTGVVEHGLFPPSLVADVIVGHVDETGEAATTTLDRSTLDH